MSLNSFFMLDRPRSICLLYRSFWPRNLVQIFFCPATVTFVWFFSPLDLRIQHLKKSRRCDGCFDVINLLKYIIFRNDPRGDCPDSSFGRSHKGIHFHSSILSRLRVLGSFALTRLREKKTLDNVTGHTLTVRSVLLCTVIDDDDDRGGMLSDVWDQIIRKCRIITQTRAGAGPFETPRLMLFVVGRDGFVWESFTNWWIPGKVRLLLNKRW